MPFPRSSVAGIPNGAGAAAVLAYGDADGHSDDGHSDDGHSDDGHSYDGDIDDAETENQRTGT